MKAYILTTVLLYSGIVMSPFNNGDYLESMKANLSQMQSASSFKEYLQVANQFQIIGEAEEGEWLPWYYHAQAYMVMIYLDPNLTFEQKDQYLDVAWKSVDRILKRFPKEAEVHVLHAWYRVCRMGLDPASAVNELGSYTAAINTSMELEPKNPRARFFKIANDIGTVQYYGKSGEEYCPQLRELLENWDNYELKSEIHPQWGKDDVAKKIAETCK